MKARGAIVVGIFALTCGRAPGKGPSPAAPSPLSAAVEGTTHPRLRTLLAAHWDYTMAHRPVWATTLGDRRFDTKIADNSRAAIIAAQQQRRVWLAQARSLSAESLDVADRTTLALFIEQTEANIASEVCEFEQWNLSAMDNPITRWNVLPKRHRVKTARDGKNFVARVTAVAGSIDNTVANLARGAKGGRYANAETTRRVVAMVEGQLAEPIDAWPLFAPALDKHPDWTLADRESFKSKLKAALETDVRPALDRYSKFLRTTVLPNARSEQESGVLALPDGQACYGARIRYHVGLKKTARQIHEIGLAEISRINQEMRELGFRLFHTRALSVIFKKLRTDPTLYFNDEKAVQQKAVDALAAAKAKMPQYFGRLPKADCVVTPMPAYEAPFSTIAYYREPFPNGEKPGEYVINTYQPKTRPRYEAEALAYHEAIPGHHLQIAIAQELPAMPAFRKHGGSTAFVEGWALYTERLAGEMGLYSGDLDRMGMLSYEAWRAARLVVDTGIHSMGWSRERAVKYMMAHTALAENNIRNEVDRYIAWPGQALAYKLGQLEILRLRAMAKRELGARFDIRGFHDVVLGAAAVSLPVLQTRVKTWIADQSEPQSSSR